MNAALEQLLIADDAHILIVGHWAREAQISETMGAWCSTLVISGACVKSIKPSIVEEKLFIFDPYGSISDVPLLNSLVSHYELHSWSCRTVAAQAGFKAFQFVIMNQHDQIGNGYVLVLDCHISHITVRIVGLSTKVDRHSGEELEKENKLLEMGENGMVKMIPNKPMFLKTSYLSKKPAAKVMTGMLIFPKTQVVDNVNSVNGPALIGKVLICP